MTNMNEEKREIIETYRIIADEYDKTRFYTPVGRYMNNIVMEVVTDFQLKGNIIDVACGTGRFLDRFGTVGLDASSKMLSIAQTKTKKSVVKGDAENLPFFDDIFDAALSFHFFMHLNDPTHILKEMKRVVKKNGFVAFDIPNETRRKIVSYSPNGWGCQKALTIKEIKNICENLEMQLEEVRGVRFFPIHKLPTGILSILNPLDKLIGKTFLKCLSGAYIVKCRVL